MQHTMQHITNRSSIRTRSSIISSLGARTFGMLLKPRLERLLLLLLLLLV